jgi:hypothetical protein
MARNHKSAVQPSTPAARLFGRPDKLREALNKLQEMLYRP